MKKTMILIMAVATTIKATAQSVTYNHDSSKQNQITVMETGGGSLTPEFYYWLLHNNYNIFIITITYFTTISSKFPLIS